MEPLEAWGSFNLTLVYTKKIEEQVVEPHLHILEESKWDFPTDL